MMHRFFSKTSLPIHLCRRCLLLRRRNPFAARTIFTCHTPPNPRPTTAADHQPPSSPAVSYLVDSCGLSPEAALTAARKFQFKTAENPDSVMALLRGHGFAQTHIAKLVTKYPRLLLCKPEKTLTPKFEFLYGLGFSRPDLAKFVSSDPQFLRRSLRNQIVPNVDFLKAILHTNENVVTALKYSSWLLLSDPRKNVAPNVEILRNHGVPDSRISKLLTHFPRTLIQGTDWFGGSVEKVKELGFDPSSFSFVLAVSMISRVSTSTWERKLVLFRSLGWSEDLTISAFKKFPFCMMVSDEKIRGIMSFLAEKLNWEPARVAAWPSLLCHSLDKRIIPRVSVFSILASKGLVRKGLSVRAFRMGEKAFLERYVIKYQEKVPELMEAYQGRKGVPG